MKAGLVVILVCAVLFGGGASVALAEDQPGEGVAPDSSPFVATRATTSGNEVTFRIDTHPELDFYQPCDGGDNLINFPINIHDVDLASVKSARLAMAVWDVDFDCGSACSYCCERDTVYVNGTQLTSPMPYLTGANQQWSAVSFDVPPSALVEGDNLIEIFIDTACGGCWCVTCDWAELTLDLGATPEIEDIEILERYLFFFYRPLQYPVTTKEFYLRPKFKNTAGYDLLKVAWSGDCAPGETDPDDPYGVTFDGGTHGKKNVTATLTYRKTGTTQTGKAPPKPKQFNVYFKKKGNDDRDKEPNWFEYWERDGAVPGMAGFIYDAAEGYGAFDPATHDLILGPPASDVHYPGAGFTIGGIHFGGAEGIDCTAEVCAHERYHKWVHEQNDGPWSDPALHSDTDKLVDSYETGTSGTLIDNPDTYDVAGIRHYPRYAPIGDQEWMAMRDGNGKVGDPKKDWAYPGKQTQASISAWGIATTATITPVATTSVAPSVLLGTTGFTGIFSDYGSDVDANGLYDFLTVGVGVSAEYAGYYRVIGRLESGTGTEVDVANELVYLDAGTYTCDLNFDGVTIHEAGNDGPFVLSVILADEDGEEYDSLAAGYTTAGYSISEFEGHQAYLNGPVSDEAQDPDLDGLYEELTFSVGVIATVPGTYEVTGFLATSDGTPICPVNTSADLTTGAQAVTLAAPGTVIRQSRQPGPYLLQSLRLLDGEKQTDFRYLAHTTPAYAYTDFEGGLAELGPATSFSDAGIDLNANGLFDVLRVDLPTSVSESGRYAVFGQLFDNESNPIGEAFSEAELTVGTSSLTLDFPGRGVRVSGKDGPYLVRYAFVYDSEGALADSLPVPYATASYSCLEFETPTAALTGRFDDRGLDVDMDGRYDWLQVDVGVFAAEAGNYALNARLMDADGNEIVWAATSGYLNAGEPQVLQLAFDGPTIYAHGVNGPYRVQDVNFYRIDNPGVAAHLWNAYTTDSAWVVVAPVADFTSMTMAGKIGTMIAFTDLSTNSPTTWLWDFGDGTASTLQSPLHAYGNAGYYTVCLTATNPIGSDTVIKERYLKVSFRDVPIVPLDPADHWALDYILACASSGIVAGYWDGTYRPELPVDRAAMAVYVARALAGSDELVPPGPLTATFSDVPTSYWAYKYVEYCYLLGVVTGYWDGTYRPGLEVNRAQMAVYVARAMVGGDENVPDDPDGTPYFPDVPGTHWAYKYVEYCHDQGIVTGYWDGTYRPDDVVSRDQMAVYVVRAFALMP